jgi:hypothetical protein
MMRVVENPAFSVTLPDMRNCAWAAPALNTTASTDTVASAVLRENFMANLKIGSSFRSQESNQQAEAL